MQNKTQPRSLRCLFSPHLRCLLSPHFSCLFCPHQRDLSETCHFDRSCSRSHREQRSGEIRFSTVAIAVAVAAVTTAAVVTAAVAVAVAVAVGVAAAFAIAVAIAVAVAVAVAVEIERGFSPASSQPRSGHRSAEGRSKPGEATDLIAFVPAVIYFSALFAQKSHVKSRNHLTPSNQKE
jgi:hypothetical protein